MQEIKDFKTTSSICCHIGLHSIPLALNLSFNILRVNLQPPSNFSFSEKIEGHFSLSFWILQLVKCTNLFPIYYRDLLYLQVLTLAKPSLYTKHSSGLMEVTRTQILKSNLQSSSKKGLSMYFCITIGSLKTTSSSLLIKEIPLPRDSPTGFKIQTFFPSR